MLIIVNVSIAALGVIWPAVVVGVTVFFLVIVASYEPLSAVPANVYGYAATVAYSLHQPSQAGAGPLENLTTASFENPLPLPIVSMVLGVVFGLVSGRVAGAMTKQVTPARDFRKRADGTARSNEILRPGPLRSRRAAGGSRPSAPRAGRGRTCASPRRRGGRHRRSCP